jgi:hypothetical protein
MSQNQPSNVADHASHSIVYVSQEIDNETAKTASPQIQYPNTMPYVGQITMMAADNYIHHLHGDKSLEGDYVSVFHDLVEFDVEIRYPVINLCNLRKVAELCGVRPEVILRDLFWIADTADDPAIAVALSSAFQIWLEDPADDNPIELLATYRQDQDEFRASVATRDQGALEVEFTDVMDDLNAL